MKDEIGDRFELDPRPNRILTTCAYGKAKVLYWQGSDVEAEIEAMGEDDLVGDYGITPPEDGIWIWEGKMDCSRPDYFTGEVDCWLEGSWRLATEDEWTSYIKDEWIWEPATVKENTNVE